MRRGRLSQARQRLGVRQSSAALAPPATSKAPEDWRSPKPDGAVVAPFQIKSGNGDGARDWELRKSGGAFESGASASWSAAVLCRFGTTGDFESARGLAQSKT